MPKLPPPLAQIQVTWSFLFRCQKQSIAYMTEWSDNDKNDGLYDNYDGDTDNFEDIDEKVT